MRCEALSDAAPGFGGGDWLPADVLAACRGLGGGGFVGDNVGCGVELTASVLSWAARPGEVDVFSSLSILCLIALLSSLSNLLSSVMDSNICITSWSLGRIVRFSVGDFYYWKARGAHK